MYNTHPEFDSRGDGPSASVCLAASLDHSTGQRYRLNSGLFILSTWHWCTPSAAWGGYAAVWWNLILQACHCYYPQHASSSTIALHLSYGGHLRWVPMLIGLCSVHTPLLKSWFSLTWLTIIYLLTYYNKKILAFIFFVAVFPVYFLPS